MRKLPAFCLAAAWLVTGGCVTAEPVTAVDGNPGSEPRKGTTPVTDEPASRRMEELALDIVSKHLSVPSSELEIVRIEPVEWRDSSLGCPQPGMEYLQVITPGYLGIIRHRSGTTHRVHMTAGGGFVCEARPEKAAAKGPSPLPTFSRSQLEALARADLADRLAVPGDEVSLIGTRPVEWPDATLGCARTDATTPSAATKGFVITLGHRGREYTYHADLRQVIPCPPIERR